LSPVLHFEAVWHALAVGIRSRHRVPWKRAVAVDDAIVVVDVA
jgi:hypothetical protein